jgi:hypothetical protein
VRIVEGVAAILVDSKIGIPGEKMGLTAFILILVLDIISSISEMAHQVNYLYNEK